MSGFCDLICCSPGDASFLAHGQSLVAEYFSPETDHYYMAIALLASHQQIKASRPNPCVGCVYVRDHKILGWGYTDDGEHGEVRAAETAEGGYKDLSGATAYVTLEPCCHRGERSCTVFLTRQGVARVVIALKDPDPRVNGGGIKELRQAQIDVEVGCLALATRRVLHAYLYHRGSGGRVVLGAKWAQSLDACLASPSGASQWISSPESLVYSQWLRYTYDAVMVGSHTFIADRPSLGLRHPFFVANSQQPLKVIFDPHLRALKHPCFAGHYQHLQQDGAGVVWLGCRDHGQRWLAKRSEGYADWYQLSDKNKALFLFELDSGQIISSLMELLESEFWWQQVAKTISVLVEGGPRLHSLILAEASFHNLHIVTCPKWLGGDHRVMPKGVLIPHAISDPSSYGLVNHHAFGEDILCEYAKVGAISLV